jgi:uncharacterized protein YgbK (DUF1537 family)
MGNIGPVTDALRAALGAEIVPATPAYPRNGRTVYLGHLFVGEALLSDSGMRNHPLTPMTDANLLRVLAAQTHGKVGLVPFADVDAGVANFAGRLAALADDGHAHAIVDAIRDEHLVVAGAACRDLPLSTGGAGFAVGLARNLALRARRVGNAWSDAGDAGPVAWLAGSCSEATRAQIEAVRDAVPSFRLDPVALAADPGLAGTIAERAAKARSRTPVLVYSTASPEDVSSAQRALGTERAAKLVEDAFRGVAVALAAAGVRTFVVAGGETSGAVVEALGVHALAIGPEIDPGVPWTVAVGGERYRLALKSGNFGARDFFLKASAMLPS